MVSGTSVLSKPKFGAKISTRTDTHEVYLRYEGRREGGGERDGWMGGCGGVGRVGACGGRDTSDRDSGDERREWKWVADGCPETDERRGELHEGGASGGFTRSAGAALLLCLHRQVYMSVRSPQTFTNTGHTRGCGITVNVWRCAATAAGCGLPRCRATPRRVALCALCACTPPVGAASRRTWF